jgi:hypothetical protein
LLFLSGCCSETEVSEQLYFRRKRSGPGGLQKNNQEFFHVHTFILRIFRGKMGRLQNGYFETAPPGIKKIKGLPRGLSPDQADPGGP